MATFTLNPMSMLSRNVLQFFVWKCMCRQGKTSTEKNIFPGKTYIGWQNVNNELAEIVFEEAKSNWRYLSENKLYNETVIYQK